MIILFTRSIGPERAIGQWITGLVTESRFRITDTCSAGAGHITGRRVYDACNGTQALGAQIIHGTPPVAAASQRVSQQ